MAINNANDQDKVPTEVDQAFRERIYLAGVVPIVSLPDGADAVRVGATLTEAGLSVIEVTLRTAQGLDAISAMRRSLPDSCVGAGTVLTPDAARAAIEAGAQFVVSPGLHLSVARTVRSLGLPALPGVMTATEIGLALDEGFDWVKLFPASLLGGLAWIRALAAPYRQVRFMPTGGLKLDDIGPFLTEPSVVAIGGSWMVEPRLLVEDLHEVASRARRAAEAVAAVRGKSVQP